MEDETGKSDIEETRMRACNLLCKVFLQRLPQLSSLSTFTDLWIGILDTMDKYMHIEASELLVRDWTWILLTIHVYLNRTFMHVHVFNSMTLSIIYVA